LNTEGEEFKAESGSLLKVSLLKKGRIEMADSSRFFEGFELR